MTGAVNSTHSDMAMNTSFWMVVVVAGLCGFVLDVCGHGRMLDPVGRSTMWRQGWNTPHQYDDNALFCGGFNVRNMLCLFVQWEGIFRPQRL